MKKILKENLVVEIKRPEMLSPQEAKYILDMVAREQEYIRSEIGQRDINIKIKLRSDFYRINAES